MDAPCIQMLCGAPQTATWWCPKVYSPILLVHPMEWLMCKVPCLSLLTLRATRCCLEIGSTSKYTRERPPWSPVGKALIRSYRPPIPQSIARDSSAGFTPPTARKQCHLWTQMLRISNQQIWFLKTTRVTVTTTPLQTPKGNLDTTSEKESDTSRDSP
ncbi:unnamed protein product [Lepidochelys kempii]